MNDVVFKHFPLNNAQEEFVECFVTHQEALNGAIHNFTKELSLSPTSDFISMINEERDIYGDNHVVTLAFLENTFIGFVTYNIDQGYLLSTVWVSPEHRRKGFGTALISQVKERAENGSLWLFAPRAKEGLLNFYQEQSFIIESSYPHTHLLVFTKREE